MDIVNRQIEKLKSLPVLTYLKTTWFLIRKNIRPVLPFLIIYSSFNIVSVLSIVMVALKTSMHFCGYTYIGPDNIIAFFTSPVTLIISLIAFSFICLVHIVGIAGIMHAYSMSMVGKKTTIRGMFARGFSAAIESLRPKNAQILIFILILLPMTEVFPLCFNSLQATIPGFVQEFIDANRVYHAAYAALIIAMVIYEINRAFSFNYLILGEENFASACRKSKKLIRGRRVFTVLCLLGVALVFRMTVTAIAAEFASFENWLFGLFGAVDGTGEALFIARNFISVRRFIMMMLAPGVDIAALTALFFEYTDEDMELTALSPKAFRDEELSRRRKLAYGAIVFVLLGYMAYDTISTPDDTDTLERGEALHRPAIVAHRGDSVNAPENTLPAFQLAVLERPEYVELDVFLTKDGEVVVCHDDDLTRVSGKKLFVHEMTYAELQDLDVGSWFSPSFSDVRISKLSDILPLFNDSITVQVEIKVTGWYGENIEEKVLNVINECGMHDQVMITSLSAEPLRRVKELDPSMITVYSMYVAWEQIDDIPFSDYYTIEESNVDTELCARVHAKGGKLFAWTVNSEESVQYLVDCGVDGILTDNPIMMRNALDGARYNAGLPRLFRIYIDAFRAY